MKKLTASVLIVVLSSSLGIVNAQKTKKDTVKTQDIEGVVITALGIRKDAKKTTQSIITVGASGIEGRPDADAFKALDGQVAGVNLNSVGGAVGSSGQLTIRGNNTISGSNQALVIVDGVPLISSAYTEDSFTGSSTTASARYADIDPNNIAEVTVIKGYSAATLYGTEGKNGVILITTKSGSRGGKKERMNVSLTQSYFINQAVLPKYQNKYGVGTNNITGGYFFSNWGAAFDDKNLANFFPGSSVVGGVVNIPHPYNFIPNATDAFNDFGLRSEFPEYQGTSIAYKPYKSVEQFFQDGSLAQTSVNINKSFENGSIGGSFGYHTEDGVIPNNTLNKFNLSVGGNAKINDSWEYSGSFSYANRSYITPPISAANGSGTTGVGASILSDVFYTPRSIPLMDLPFEGPLSSRSVYYRANNGIQNPRWTAKYARSTEDNDHITLGSSITKKFGKDKSLLYRFGLDIVNQKNEYRTPRGGVQNPVTNLGFYRTVNYNEKIYNHDLIFSWDIDEFFNKDLSLNIVAGGQAKRKTLDQFGLSSTGQEGFNVWEHSNFTSTSSNNLLVASGNRPTDLAFLSRQNLLGVFGSLEFGYKGYLYLNILARNDWSSTLEKDYRQIFYPSAGLSFIATDAFPNLKSKNLNLLKFRTAYGSSGSFPDPYQTRNSLVATNNAFISGASTINTHEINSILGNSDLKPELYKEMEYGIEAKFFNNRLSLNATYFDRTTKDLIIPGIPLDYSTGYTSFASNVSKVDRKGLEIELGITPIRKKDFSWTINNSFYRDRSEVRELAAGQTKTLIAGLAGGLGNYAVVGEQLGVMMGYDILRDASGNPIVTSDGYYQPTTELQVIGDPNPDFTLTLMNSFTYKGFNLGFRFDFQNGGDIYSSTVATLLGRGSILDFDRSNTYVLPGVKSDGTPNDIQLTAFNYMFNYYSTGNNISGAIHKNAIWDATHLRLGELTIGYSLPKKMLENTSIGALSISLIGNNLWYRAFNMPKEARFDPSVSSTGVGNGQGFDFLTNVPIRRYGMSVKLTF